MTVTGLLSNAPDSLYIPTYDNSNQLVHTSIIDFQNDFGIANWSGYRYWMAFTPLPGGGDAYENPSLVVSNDGTTWAVPSGITNPLAVPAVYQVGRTYYSDTDLVYDPVEDCLRIYWRYANQPPEGVTYPYSGYYDELRMIKVFNNKTKSAVYNLLQTPWNVCMFSPTICRESADRWHMWYHSYGNETGTNVNDGLINYRFSTDGLTWGEAQSCGKPAPSGCTASTWHLSVEFNKWENRFEFICQATLVDKSGLYPGARGDSYGYLEAPLNNPTVLTNGGLTRPILTPSNSYWTWDNNYLYRGNFTIERQADHYNYRVWYTGCNLSGVYLGGYTEGALGTTFSAVTPAQVEPIYYGAQFDATTFDTVVPDYFPATYSRLYSPVTITIDTIRKISQTVTNLTDTKRKVTNSNIVNSDTNRKLTNTNTLNPDTKRIVRVSNLVQAETQRLVSALVLTASDTLRQVMGTNMVTSTVDTIRRVFVTDSGQADTKIKIANTDIIRGDTRRSVWLRVQNAVDTVRGIRNNITNSVDTLRQIVNLDVTVVPFDTIRKVVNSQFIRVDTKRSVWKQVQTFADTIRKFFTGGVWPVSLEIEITSSRVDLDAIPRKVTLEVDGQVQNIVVTAGNLIELKATFYDKDSGLPADPSGTVKFVIYDSRRKELQSFTLDSSHKKSDGVFAMEYPTPLNQSLLFFEASSTLGEQVEVERGEIKLRWAI